MNTSCGWGLLGMVVVLAGCGGANQVGYEGGKPVADIDAVQRAAQHPDPIVDEDSIETHVVMDVPAPPDRVFDFFQHMPVDKVFRRTKSIPGVVSVKVLTPGWDGVGSRRRVTLDDDSTTLEEILTFERGKSFRYILWNFTNDTGKAALYTVGDLEFQAIPGGTHLTFTYDFRGRGFPFNAILRDVVDTDFHEFLGYAMDEVRKQSPSWFPAPPAGQAGLVGASPNP